MDKSSSKVKQNGFRRSNSTTLVFYLLLLIFVFWLGVYFASVFIEQKVIKSCEVKQDSAPVDPESLKDIAYSRASEDRQNSVQDVSITSTEIFSQIEVPSAAPVQEKVDNGVDKKVIVLYGPKIWNRYDKWKDSDWEKCPQPNCRISTDAKEMDQSSAVVFNALAMPPHGLLKSLKDLKTSSPKKTKFVFMSGLTPLQTYFNPETYDGFFDLTMTYKSDSDIRISFWPNDGILPAMLRPKEPGNPLSDEKKRHFREQNNHYFLTEGKENHIMYSVDSCDEKLLYNAFAVRFRWEGDVSILSRHKCNATKMGFPDIGSFPCVDKFSDSCSKFLESFKFVLLPEKVLCKDFMHRVYWHCLRGWEAVPILWGSDDVKGQAIPGSYINVLDYEYIGYAFKDALASKTSSSEYSKYMIWKEEDRLEEFYWQCELCSKLHSNNMTNIPLNFSKFWDSETNCGRKTTLFKSARDQLIRNGINIP